MIAFSETWLHEGILRGELGMENFTIFLCDRSKLTSSNERGGGVLIAVRSNITCKEVKSTVKNIEQLFVILTLNNQRTLLNVVYIPPQSSVS